MEKMYGVRISTGMEDLFDEQELQAAIEASLHDHALQLLLEEPFCSSLLQLLQIEEAQIPSQFACSSSNSHAGSSTAPAEVYSLSSARTGKEVVEQNEVSPLMNQLCGICLEDKYPSEIFDGMVCSHRFCSTCITLHIRNKLQEKLVSIDCPDPNCSEHLTPEQCVVILPKQTFEEWSLALVEADIPLSQKFYCPFRNCSAVLLKDIAPDELGSSSGAAAVVIKESECPECRRLFCAQCGVPWHAGLDCSEFQRLSDSEKEICDLMLFKLAKECEWQRCASCKHIVERSSGCCHMLCRCGYEFCYKCGSEWKEAGMPCNCSG
jgi:E3 ubiquitin-protein ligase RNF144